MAGGIDKIDKFHRTRRGRIVFAATELALAYAVVSAAIDTGSFLLYAASALLLIGAASNFIAAMGPAKRHDKRRSNNQKKSA